MHLPLASTCRHRPQCSSRPRSRPPGITIRLSEPGASISPGLGRPLRGYQPATGRPLRRLSSHAASGLRQHRRLGLHPPGSLFVHSCRRAGSGERVVLIARYRSPTCRPPRASKSVARSRQRQSSGVRYARAACRRPKHARSAVGRVPEASNRCAYADPVAQASLTVSHL